MLKYPNDYDHNNKDDQNWVDHNKGNHIKDDLNNDPHKKIYFVRIS